MDAATLLDRAIRLAYECGLRDARESTVDRAAALGTGRSGAAARAPLGALTCIFDLLVEGVLVVGGSGRTVFLSPALGRVLQEDEEGDVLLHRMRQLALALPRGPRIVDTRATTVCELHTAVARYRLRAAWAEDPESDAEVSAVVTIERLSQRLPSAAAMMDRYGFTAREAGCALLLAQGHSNAGVARQLAISSHTARHHTENVLLKLDVHSRAEVGPKVLGTPLVGGRQGGRGRSASARTVTS